MLFLSVTALRLALPRWGACAVRRLCKAFALPFAQLMLPEYGEYAIKVAIDRIALASVPLYVLAAK